MNNKAKHPPTKKQLLKLNDNVAKRFLDSFINTALSQFYPIETPFQPPISTVTVVNPI